MKEVKTYTIRQIADLFLIPASTLRYYEEIQLLNHVEHDQKKQRIYTQEHIERLNAIQCFKKAGLSLEDMLRFFYDEQNLEENINDIICIMREREEEVNRKLQELQEGKNHIRHKIWFYQEIKKAMEQGSDWPCWDDYRSNDESNDE